MGATHAKSDHHHKCNNNTCVSRNVVTKEPLLLDDQKLLLIKVWATLKDDIAKVGVIAFVNLFETHPEVRDAFLPFRDLQTAELEYSAILRSHALRVMGTVDKCIARLEHPDRLKDLMTDLGIRHQNYNAKFEYIDLMGPQFIMSIKHHLADEWTNEYEEAWNTLFNLMTFYMKNGMCSI